MKTASQLPAASTLTGDEKIWADQGATTVSVTPEQIKTYANSGTAAAADLAAEAAARAAADAGLQTQVNSKASENGLAAEIATRQAKISDGDTAEGLLGAFEDGLAA